MNAEMMQAPLGALGIFAVMTIIKQLFDYFKKDKASDNAILEKVLDEISKSNKSESKLVGELMRSNVNNVNALSSKIDKLVGTIQENNVVLAQMVVKEDQTKTLLMQGFADTKSSLLHITEKWDKNISKIHDRLDNVAEKDRFDQVIENIQYIKVAMEECRANSLDKVSQEDIDRIVKG